MANSGHIKDENYQFLTQYFEVSKLHDRYETLHADIIRAIENIKLDDKAYIDEESLQTIILDYFYDIARLKDFHSIELANTDKIYGYELFWFLRRHPVYLLDDPANLIINEKIAIGVFLPKILSDAGLPCDADKQSDVFKKRLKIFIDLLYYNIRHRIYTQQSLELMIEAFFCGSELAVINATPENTTPQS